MYYKYIVFKQIVAEVTVCLLEIDACCVVELHFVFICITLYYADDSIASSTKAVISARSWCTLKTRSQNSQHRQPSDKFHDERY